MRLQIFAMFLFLLISLVNAQNPIEINYSQYNNTLEKPDLRNKTNLTIQEKLDQCQYNLNETLDLYNTCSEDYRKGLGCGMAYGILSDFNKKCTEERNEALDNLGSYRTGFFISTGIILLFGFYKILINLKGGQDEN